MMFRGLGDEKGQDLVEFALIASLLFLLIFGIIDLGIVVWNYDTIANAAREGARYGVIDSPPHDRCYGVNGICEHALRLTMGLDQDPGRLQCICTRVDTTVRVTVTYDAQLITAPVIEAMGVPSLTLRSVATMQRE